MLVDLENIEQDKYGSVLLLSGGLDSSVVAAQGALSGQPPLCVFVNQGFKTHRSAATLVADNLDLDLICFDMGSTFGRLMHMSNCLNPGQKFMPGYRLYTWMIGLSVAQMCEINVMTTGEYGLSSFSNWNPEAKGFQKYLAGESVHDNDPIADIARSEAQSDARSDFSAMFNQLQGIGSAVQICDPLYHLDKTGVVKLGKALGAPMHLTSSCRNSELDGIRYGAPTHEGEGHRLNCGMTACGFCNARRSAFVLAEVEDNSVYIRHEEIDPSYLGHDEHSY